MGSQLSNILLQEDTDTQALSTLARSLGDLMGGDLRAQSKDVQLGFVTTRGEAFKNELLHLLAGQLDDPGQLAGDYENAPESVKAFLDEAYATAASQLGNRYVDENTITLDGVNYTKGKQIGQGGFGVVHIYEGTKNGEPHRIVVKTPVVMDPSEEGQIQAFHDASAEARAHRAALEDNPGNIVDFYGAIPRPDGQLLLAIELAPYGDLGDFSANLTKLVNDGTLSPHAANLMRISLMKDMAEGLQHLHETRGMTHIDLKAGNFFIGSDGRAKLGDFGLARLTLDPEYQKKPVDAPSNISPEMLLRHNEVVKDRSDLQKAIKKMNEQLTSKAVVSLPENERTEVEKQINDTIAELERLHKEVSFTVNEKTDVWSLGVAAHELFFGTSFISTLTDSTFTFKREQALEAFGQAKDPTVRARGLDSQGKQTGVGVTELDRAINQMLNKDPDKRLGMSDLLTLSLFSEPGLDNPDIQELTKLVSDPKADPAAIKALSDKLGI